MQDQAKAAGWEKPVATAVLVMADGTVIEGFGFGAVGKAVGEVCFNTAMTGYQEILTDPSYAAQIVTFTFPHIGNVGVNDEDVETVDLGRVQGARGVIVQAPIGAPSNFRSAGGFEPWLVFTRHYRNFRRGHPRADDADSRKGHAQCGDRPCARRRVRSRGAQGRGRRLAGH